MEKEIISLFFSSGAVMSISRNRVLIGWGECKWLENRDFNDSLFYFPDYFLKEKAWVKFEYTQILPTESLLKLVQESIQKEPPKYQWNTTHKSVFQDAFNELQGLFTKGTLQKAVPFIYEKAQGNISPENLSHMLCKALSYTLENPVHLYGIWNRKEGMLGATPEFLFELTGSNLNTVACAGTSRNEQAEHLANDPKQLREHQIVVEGICEALSPYGEVSAEKRRVVKFPNLCHLMTPITLVSSAPLNAEKMIHALHPTPALGAHPKEEGMKWLMNYDKKIKRERFGAPAGYAINKICAAYVAIRNLQWSQGELKICAGCGVVPDSKFDAEWDEICLKIKSIKHILGL